MAGPMQLRVVDGKLTVVYGTVGAKRLIDICFSSTADLLRWSPPVKIVGGLKGEDVLMQIPPTFAVTEKSMLVSIADIYGSWTEGEFKARVFVSRDGGVTWPEIAGPKAWAKNPPNFVFGVGLKDRYYLLEVASHRSRGRGTADTSGWFMHGDL